MLIILAGVKHFVYSTLSNSKQESNGKYGVDHFSTKANVEDYIRAKGFKYTAFPAAAFYYQNFQSFFPPKADENGNYTITYTIVFFLFFVELNHYLIFSLIKLYIIFFIMSVNINSIECQQLLL